MNRNRVILSLTAFFAALSCAAWAAEPTAAPVAPSTIDTSVPASDPRIVLEGRFDMSNPAMPVVIWQASRIRFGFTGESAQLWFSNIKGQVFFDADVDGHKTLIALRENQTLGPVTLKAAGTGRHDVVLFKRSEANAGTVGFRGVDVPPGGAIFAGTRPNYAMKMGFIGDSITVGACNEDGASDQWDDRSTHNAALSWAALTAEAFAADQRNIAVSGMGIVIGWVEQKAGETWNRVYPTPSSRKIDLNKWVPDIVFVNLGENDDSFTRAHNMPFPASFTEQYVALVSDVRRSFPNAQVVLLRGGMSGGATSEPLRKAWEAAVDRLEKGDPHVHHYVFKHWSKLHPRVADDRAMAEELTAWLRRQDFVPRAAK